MSDLVQRLRKAAEVMAAWSPGTPNVEILLCEAADHIEALEADSIKWQSAYRTVIDLESRIKELEAALQKIKCKRPERCVVEITPNVMEYYWPCCIARRALEGK